MIPTTQQLHTTLFQGKGYYRFKHGFSKDEDLEAFAESLGSPLLEPRNERQKSVYYVQKEKRQYASSFARTQYYFSLHTDCSDLTYVPEIVLLYCVKNCSIGGETLLLDTNQILPNIPSSLLDKLSQKFFFRDKQFPIYDAQQKSIRYNRLLLEMSPNESTDLFEELDEILEPHSFKLKLNTGECILINNHRLLHGRTEYVDADRLLKRVRISLT